MAQHIDKTTPLSDQDTIDWLKNQDKQKTEQKPVNKTVIEPVDWSEEQKQKSH